MKSHKFSVAIFLLFLKSATFLHASQSKVVAVGDVHGDLKVWTRALQLAGAINSAFQWTGGNLTVVQTGDLIDRGPTDKDVIDFSEKLASEAKLKGGKLILLNGNHEIMNARGDMRYVSAESFSRFSNGSVEFFDFFPIQNFRLSEQMTLFNTGVRERLFAFAPGGAYAKILGNHPVFTVIEDSVFVHGGILPKYLDQLESLNETVSLWLKGEAQFPDWLENKDSPIWSREYSNEHVTISSCRSLRRVLRHFNAKRMVVGHTIQKNGITSFCNNSVWRIDVGLSHYYHKDSENDPVEILSIDEDGPKVLHGS